MIQNLEGKSDSYKRGFDDGMKGRPALFRNVRGSWEPTVDDDGADAWTQEQRHDYMAGINAGEDLAAEMPPRGCGAALFGGNWIGLGTCGQTRLKGGKTALCAMCEGL